MSNHYLYIYLDPRKPGKFTYSKQVSFLFEPIYVGKGTGDRYLAHIKECINWNFTETENKIKSNKIKKNC